MPGVILGAEHVCLIHKGEACKKVLVCHLAYSEALKNMSVLSLRAYVIVGRKIALGTGKKCFWYEGRTGIVTEGPRAKEKLGSATVCTVCGAKNLFPVEFRE
jgi:hypothetical protein